MKGVWEKLFVFFKKRKGFPQEYCPGKIDFRIAGGRFDRKKEKVL